MNILMIAHYITFPSEGGNSRFCYILDLLKNDNKLELITSDFRHATKKRHTIDKNELEKLGYKVTMLHEPRYKKNITIKRLYSSRILAKNIKKYLNNLTEKPDIIYCAVPSLDLAKEAAKFAKRNKIRFIIDIQDLWPEAFRMALNIPVLSDILFYPMTIKANYIYKAADEIIGVSQTYVNRALAVNKTANGLSVFLGTDLNQFEKAANNHSHIKYKKITAAYVGTLGHSYDLKTAIDAIAIAKQKGVDIKFLIMGDGPLRNEYEKFAMIKGIDCEFTGRLPYKEMCRKLSMCHFAINPIKKNAPQSIINKHADYAIAQLPVVSTQEPGEYCEIINKYGMGINCVCEDANDLAEGVMLLCSNRKKRLLMSKKSKKCAKDLFDRKTSYLKIIKVIKEQQ